MIVIVIWQNTIQEVREYREYEELEGYFRRETLKCDEDYCVVQLDQEKRDKSRKEKEEIESVNWQKPKVYKPRKEEE